MSGFRIDFSDLVNNLDVDEAITNELIDDLQTKVGLDLLGTLVLATPVDTGEARNGWQMSGEGDLTVIENRVPYINRLNEGHSKQAPAGFVENAIDEVVARFK